MNKSFIASVVISITALGIACYSLFANTNDNVAFVNLKELFENFELKKQMQIEFDKTIELRKKELSQMKLNIENSVNAGRINSDTLTMFKNMYDSKAMEFRETNLALSQEMDLKIYKQLRIYLLQFMKQHRLTLVVAQSEEDLNIICEGNNVTKDAITFINKTFNDK